jgi:hypothetical protein
MQSIIVKETEDLATNQSVAVDDEICTILGADGVFVR